MIKLLFVSTEVGRELKSSCNKGFCVSKERFLMIRSGIIVWNLHQWSFNQYLLEIMFTVDSAWGTKASARGSFKVS